MLRRTKHGEAATSRRTNLHQLLRVAGIVQQQAVGDSIELTTSDIGAAERVAKQIKDKLRAQDFGALEDVEKLWSHPSQETASVLALFSLALRRSSPFASGAGTPSAFANIRANLNVHLETLTSDSRKYRTLKFDTIGRLMLRTDALGCYTRLLSEAGEQLKAAAIAALPGAQREGQGGQQQQGPRRQPPAPGEQRQGPRPQQIDHELLERLLDEVITVAAVPCTDIMQRQLRHMATVRNATSDSPIPAGAPEQPLQQETHAQLQSSWVLEHYARVLLLGTAPALSGGNSKQQKAQSMQTESFHRLCMLYILMQLDMADFVRRPWGCTLAFIHMARLCAAMDGAERYGLPPHAALTLPEASPLDTASIAQTDYAAEQSDEMAMRRGQAFSLLPALLTLRAWTELLGEGQEGMAKELPAAAGAGAGLLAADGASAAGEHEGRGACTSSTEQGRVGIQVGVSVRGEEGRVQLAAAGASPCRLPPLNRSVTIDVCLRLARGVLANWGAVIPRVKVSAGDGSRPSAGGRMTKGSGSAVVQHALECARLALLPNVWGRVTVRGRTRAQLRAWWATYVAAAQHPEALLVAEPQWLEYPDWIARGLGLHSQPSADSVAALEAGLLPCVTKLVMTRMGEANDGGPLWCPPDRFPGVEWCWPGVMLFGPLGQVGVLASGLGRQLHLAAQHLQRGAAEWAGGRPDDGIVQLLAKVAHEALRFAGARMKDVLSGALRLGAAGEGPAAGTAVRLSIVAAEVLPGLSLSLQAFAKLVRVLDLGDGQGQEGLSRRAARQPVRDGIRGVTDCIAGYAAGAFDYVMGLLARHCLETAEQLPGSGGGPAAADALDSSGGGGGVGGADVPWRQFLLRDVQLMQLLVAASELHSACRTVSVRHEASASLAAALHLAAAAFPAEFRAAVQDGGGGEGGAVPLSAAAAFPAEPSAGSVVQDGSGGGVERAAAARGQGPKQAGSTHSMVGAAAVLEALSESGSDGDGEPGVAARVLRGWDPSPEEAWGAVRSAVGNRCEIPEEKLVGLLRNLLPPVEARAAAAAAVAAEAAPAPTAASTGNARDEV